MYKRRTFRRVWRPLAFLTVICFVWSFVLAPGALALAQPSPSVGHIRTLTPDEMRAIVGAQIVPNGFTTGTDPDAGTPYPWEGNINNTNTVNGNKLSSFPLVGWTARGGLPVQFTLYHNSKGSYNRELGQKWTHSFLLTLTWDVDNGIMTMRWGDDLNVPYTQNINGSFSPPPGVHDQLIANGNPATSYDVITKGQIKYHFGRQSGSTWYCTSISDPNGNTITLNYNASNYLTSIVDTTNRTITLGYDGSNRISTITDPLNRQWTLSYNASNDLVTITWPAVGGFTYTQQFVYNANHDITTYTDRRGSNWTFGYNADNSLAWQKDPLLNQTGFTYNTSQTVITDPNGHVIKHNYDASGRLSSVVDALNNTESYGYDSNNNRTSVTDRNGHLWQFGYDSNGNVTSRTDPLTHQWTWTYNSRNRVLTATDPLGHQTVNTYDATLNWNLIQTQQKDSNGTVLSTTSYTYNADGTVHSKTDSNNHTTTYGYNANGDLTSVTTPLGHVTSFGYNALGVKTSRTDALNRTTNYTLDNWERVTTITYPDSSTKTFSYDPEGNLTGWTDSNGTWSRTYDAANRITSEKLNNVARFTYSYDAVGQKGLLSTLTDTNWRVITYSYTARNELASVSETGGTTSYGYDANGNETSITNPNGTSVTKAYDAANRLTSVTNKTGGGATLSSFSYGYNADDLRTSVTEADGSVVSYGYDGAHRLTSESRTGTNPYTKSYVVDGVGNRTSQTVGGVTTSFTYDADDELTSTSGGIVNSYGYNANGEQTSRTLSGTAYTLSYDFDGQLTSLKGGGVTKSFAYDALGRRISRTAGGVTTQFLTDPLLGHVWLEAQGSTTTATYTYGNALVRKDGEYPLFDGLGSERTVTNASQSVTATINYDAFGHTVGTTGSSANPYMYAATSGYRTDGDGGLLLVGARYYDPQVGRFLTRDTVLSEPPYLYCHHDPVNCLDPTGHMADMIDELGRIFGRTPVRLGGLSAIGYGIGSMGDVFGWPALSHAGQVLGDIAMIGGAFAAGAGATTLAPVIVSVVFVTVGGVAIAKHIAIWIKGQ